MNESTKSNVIITEDEAKQFLTMNFGLENTSHLTETTRSPFFLAEVGRMDRETDLFTGHLNENEILRHRTSRLEPRLHSPSEKFTRERDNPLHLIINKKRLRPSLFTDILATL